jgi:formylglycine-generating enzyme required for sulfatase activity
MRGGSFGGYATDLPSFSRSGDSPSTGLNYSGGRCARNAP